MRCAALSDRKASRSAAALMRSRQTTCSQVANKPSGRPTLIHWVSQITYGRARALWLLYQPLIELFRSQQFIVFVIDNWYTYSYIINTYLKNSTSGLEYKQTIFFFFNFFCTTTRLTIRSSNMFGTKKDDYLFYIECLL